VDGHEKLRASMSQAADAAASKRLGNEKEKGKFK
jgi:hypothetical protein